MDSDICVDSESKVVSTPSGETRISYIAVYSGHKFALKNEGTAHVRDVSLFGGSYMSPSIDPCSSLALLNYGELHLVDSRYVL